MGIFNKADKTPIVTKLASIINNRVPLIGVGHLHTKEDMKEALIYDYDLLAIGMIALSDKDVVEKIKNNEVPNTTFRKEDLLPTPMFELIKRFIGSDSDFKIEK